ncbi:MAG: sensor histidine kinase [Acidimicrobiales bacterium]
MRRSDLRRLEIALQRVADQTSGATGSPASRAAEAGADELLADIEAAAADLAARAQSAEELGNRLSAALNVLVPGVVVCDEHGDEVYRNLAASGVGARLGDVLAEQAIADQLETARRGECAERSLELFSPVRRNLMIRAFPIASLDRPLGAVAVIEDISERRRLDAIRRDFVANVSHELKTPVGALSLLAETLDGEDDPEVVARLSVRVAAEAERLGRVIDDLLDLSRIEANERPRFEPMPVSQLVHDAVDPIRRSARAREIELAVEPMPPHLTVTGDRRDLMSAITNLLDNAVKYSEPGSPVKVRVTAGREAVRIDVIDKGIGIPPRDRERIFERFYRVDRARSRLTGGTGLGLSIVRHVAANHGGDVRVESEEGEGSTFTLVLPAQPAPRSGGPADG